MSRATDTMKIVRGDGKDISVFVKEKGDAIKKALEAPGAILLRGFNTVGVEIDELARLLGFVPSSTYIPGIAPRKAYMSNNSCVFTSTEAPPHLPILPHTEMTYWPQPPDVLMFQCKNMEEESDAANETVIFDNKASAEELSQELLKKLAQVTLTSLVFLKTLASLPNSTPVQHFHP